mgnify:CR=1 FL=1|tara:strand:+ start:196 stop:426 length:231 start_codon:yes stop_codon:yes gene_type:complete
MSVNHIDKIISSIAKVIDEPIKNITINSKSIDFKKWDSLAHVRIIIEIERITKKKIAVSKVAELLSVKAISDYISK